MAFGLGSGAAFAASQAPQAGTHEAAPASVTFHHLSLVNGWKSSQSQYGSGNPSAGSSNGVVYLSGSLHQPSGTSTKFATLPQACRPSHYLYLPIYTLGGGDGSLEISPGGAVSLFGSGDRRGYSSLAGVSYPLGS